MNTILEFIESKWVEIVFAAVLGLIVQLYLNYRNNRNQRKDRLRESLSLIYSYVYEAKEYSFMIVEFAYLWKYFDVNSKKHFYEDDVIMNFEDYEKYRMKLVELDTKIYSNIAVISSLNNKIGRDLKKSIRTLRLRGRGIPNFKLNMHELINSNRTPLGVSHMLQNHFYKESQLGNHFRIVLREIESAYKIVS